MSKISEKLKLRAFVVSLLSKYRSNTIIEHKILQKDIDSLLEIENKEDLAKVLYKELSQAKDDYSKKIALFILEVLDEDIIFRFTCQYLIDKSIKDDVKFFMVSIAKQKGIALDDGEVKQNIESCQKIEKESIRRFLKNATLDPEVQIDFLDFYINISRLEKISLLNNLINDLAQEENNEEDNEENEEIDNILSAFALLLKLELSQEEKDIIENYLLNSKNSLRKSALLALFELEKTQKSPKQKEIQKRVKKIEFLDKTPLKKEFIENTKIERACIGLLDGQSEFSLALARKKDDDTFMLSFFTINTYLGITSCVGFNNIDEESLNSILKRVYYNFPPASINPIALKSIYSFFRQKNEQTKTIVPYEAFVWEKLFLDVREINFPLDEFFNSKLELVDITPKRFENLKNSIFLESWFYSYHQNSFLEKIINKIETEKDVFLKDIEKVDTLMLENVAAELYLNRDFSINLKNNLVIQSYIAKLLRRVISSGVLYSLTIDKKYFTRLVLFVFKKSIYQYFLYKKECLENNAQEDKFKLSKNKNFTLEDTNKIIELIEEKWKLKKE